MSEREHIELDQDVRSTAEGIERVAERLRNEPSAGFEDRVFMGTRPVAPVAGRIRFLTPMRVAAVLALGLGAAAVLTMRPGSAPVGQMELASLEADFDEWLEFTAVFDDGLSFELDAAAAEASILSAQDLVGFVDEESL